MTGIRKAWSVSIYCRHEGAVLLVLHDRVLHERVWIPIGGEIKENETPLEAASRQVIEGTGLNHFFPVIHKVHGAPPGLLLYEEHEEDEVLHMNFAFIAEVPNKRVRLDESCAGMLWVSSLIELPEPVLPSVLGAMPYALTAGT